MNRIVTNAGAMLAMASTTGCSLLSENAETVGKAAGDAVHFYCDNVAIPEVRDEIRATVNRYAAPHSIAVTCADATAPN